MDIEFFSHPGHPRLNMPRHNLSFLMPALPPVIQKLGTKANGSGEIRREYFRQTNVGVSGSLVKLLIRTVDYINNEWVSHCTGDTGWVDGQSHNWQLCDEKIRTILNLSLVWCWLCQHIQYT